jgi:hypothetical protein
MRCVSIYTIDNFKGVQDMFCGAACRVSIFFVFPVGGTSTSCHRLIYAAMIIANLVEPCRTNSKKSLVQSSFYKCLPISVNQSDLKKGDGLFQWGGVSSDVSL